MRLSDQLTDILKKCSAANLEQPSPTVQTDFEVVCNHCPHELLAEGLKESFRSDRTLDFGDTVSDLYMRSDSLRRIGVLAVLLSALRPNGFGASAALGKVIRAFQRGQLTPDLGGQISAHDVQQLAAHTDKTNATVLDRVSAFYSQHPDIVQTLGPEVLSLVLVKMAQQQAKLPVA